MFSLIENGSQGNTYLLSYCVAVPWSCFSFVGLTKKEHVEDMGQGQCISFFLVKKKRRRDRLASLAAQGCSLFLFFILFYWIALNA